MKVDDEALRNRVEMFGEEAGGYIYRLESKLSTAETELKRLHNLRPRSEYHEDFGTVLWYSVPIVESPVVDGYDLDGLDWSYNYWAPIPTNPTIAGEPDVL